MPQNERPKFCDSYLSRFLYSSILISWLFSKVNILLWSVGMIFYSDLLVWYFVLTCRYDILFRSVGMIFFSDLLVWYIVLICLYYIFLLCAGIIFCPDLLLWIDTPHRQYRDRIASFYRDRNVTPYQRQRDGIATKNLANTVPSVTQCPR